MPRRRGLACTRELLWVRRERSWMSTNSLSTPWSTSSCSAGRRPQAPRLRSGQPVVTLAAVGLVLADPVRNAPERPRSDVSHQLLPTACSQISA
jgi:hypothetical protein